MAVHAADDSSLPLVLSMMLLPLSRLIQAAIRVDIILEKASLVLQNMYLWLVFGWNLQAQSGLEIQLLRTQLAPGWLVDQSGSHSKVSSSVAKMIHLIRLFLVC